MATQRRTATGKTVIDRPQAPVKSDITPAVPPSIIFKLLFFTFAMITLPIGTYFLSRDMLFSGNSTYAGGTAALMANVVLIGYVIVAFKDDQAEREADSKKSR